MFAKGILFRKNLLSIKEISIPTKEICLIVGVLAATKLLGWKWNIAVKDTNLPAHCKCR